MRKKSDYLLLIVVTVLAIVMFIGRLKTQPQNPSAPVVSAAPTLTPIDYTPAKAPINSTPSVTERDWAAYMTLPDSAEVNAFNVASTNRSPYLTATADTSGCRRFTQYAVDFRAEYLPTGTYCCLANFDLDYSSLLTAYTEYNTAYNGVAGYAGFQRNLDGRMNSIMSFWDVYCRDASGNETLIRAKRLSPVEDGNSNFSGEGTGVHCLVDYPWQAGRWYRMMLQCSTSETTGNTVVEQWVCDLESGIWSSLCKYDLGVPNVCFQGNVAAFLECFQYETAGNVRSMELRNIRIADAGSGEWTDVRRIYCSTAYDYPGSYAYGADEHTVYMISTGLDGMAGKPQEDMAVMVSNLESGAPY